MRPCPLQLSFQMVTPSFSISSMAMVRTVFLAGGYLRQRVAARLCSLCTVTETHRVHISPHKMLPQPSFSFPYIPMEPPFFSSVPQLMFRMRCHGTCVQQGTWAAWRPTLWRAEHSWEYFNCQITSDGVLSLVHEKVMDSGTSKNPAQWALRRNFFLSAPVAFRRVALYTPEWTSRDSNHRQSVSAGKTNAIPTEPSGRLNGHLDALPLNRWSL